MPKAKAGRSLRTFKSCGRPVAAITCMPHAGCAGLRSLLGCALGPDLHPHPRPRPAGMLLLPVQTCSSTPG